MSAIAIIPARAGSKRIPRKNVRMFHGKPMIVHSIDAAKECSRFDTIAVSTDDLEVARIAADCGVTVLWRPPVLCDDAIGTDSVMQYHMTKLQVFDYACCIYATAPLISQWDLRTGFDWLRESEDIDFVFAMGIDPNQDAAQWYWGRTAAWCLNIHFVGKASRVFQIKADRHCDINTIADWARAERMFAKLHDLPWKCDHDYVMYPGVHFPDGLHFRCSKCGEGLPT